MNFKYIRKNFLKAIYNFKKVCYNISNLMKVGETVDINKKTYSVAEAAKVLGISTPKLYQLCHAEGFPAVRLGNRIVIPIENLDKWLDEQCSAKEKSLI